MGQSRGGGRVHAHSTPKVEGMGGRVMYMGAVLLLFVVCTQVQAQERGARPDGKHHSVASACHLPQAGPYGPSGLSAAGASVRYSSFSQQRGALR